MQWSSVEGFVGWLLDGDEPMGWHMGWLSIWWILGAGVIAVLLWGLIKSARSSASGRAPDSPDAVLERRYAVGEGDRRRFQRRRGDLGK